MIWNGFLIASEPNRTSLRAYKRLPIFDLSRVFFFSSRRRHTISVSAFLLNRSSDLSNLQSFIASMTQKLTLSDISDESKNYLDKAGITTACLRIKSKWTAGGK